MTTHHSAPPQPPHTWHVAYTKPRQERVALENLQRQGFDTYLPLFKVFRKRRRPAASASAGGVLVHEPMFPRYLFFRATRPDQSFATLRSTRGVASVVRFGVEFAVVPQALIQAIHAVERQRDEADMGQVSPFQPGCRVRLSDPSLAGLEGLVQESSAKRVVVLLSILGRQKTLKVDHAQIELA
jgi:transcriptional antiterminator RfaH